MQRVISNKIQLDENLNPLRDISNAPSIDNVANLKDVFGKVDKLGVLWNKGETGASLVRYISSLSDVSKQGQIINHKKAYAAQTYTDQKIARIYSKFSGKHLHELQQHVCCVTNSNKEKKVIKQQTLMEH